MASTVLPAGQAQRMPSFPSLVGASIGLFSQECSAIDVWRELGRFWARFRKEPFKEAYQPMKGARWGDYHQVLCRLSPSQAQVSLAKPFLGLPDVGIYCVRECFDYGTKHGEAGWTIRSFGADA